jgi:hypothetical protein
MKVPSLGSGMLFNTGDSKHFIGMVDSYGSRVCGPNLQLHMLRFCRNSEDSYVSQGSRIVVGSPRTSTQPAFSIRKLEI